MLAWPCSDFGPAPAEASPIAADWRDPGLEVRHTFTHFELELGLAIYAGERFEALEGGEWWPVERIEEAGLPTLFAKAGRLAVR